MNLEHTEFKKEEKQPTKQGMVFMDKEHQRARKNIVLIIPYRDRDVHFLNFKNHFKRFSEVWSRSGQVFHVFVVEQWDDDYFNRGWLFNVGLDIVLKTNINPDCIAIQVEISDDRTKLKQNVFHQDVDNLPFDEVDYGSCDQPTQLSSEIECWGWSVPYSENVGGTVVMNQQDWGKVQGIVTSTF
jgi:hypothetical protein